MKLQCNIENTHSATNRVIPYHFYNPLVTETVDEIACFGPFVCLIPFAVQLNELT